MGSGVLIHCSAPFFAAHYFDSTGPDHIPAGMFELVSLLRLGRDGRTAFGGHFCHQTRQAFSRTIGWPTLQANALANSGMFETTPLMRYSFGRMRIGDGVQRACSRRARRRRPTAPCR